MFHRLVEIGLANPANRKSEGFDLGPIWLNRQKNLLLSSKEIDDAIHSQPEWHLLSVEEQQQTRLRIVELATLLSEEPWEGWSMARKSTAIESRASNGGVVLLRS